jgi:RNA polymerase sigma-70 factor (ECF subfamily)
MSSSQFFGFACSTVLASFSRVVAYDFGTAGFDLRIWLPYLASFVPSESNSMEPLLSSSDEGTSTPPGASKTAQLPTTPRVETGVSTATLDRGMLMAASPHASGAFSPAVAGVDADAEVMLRAKAGDQSAFEYLVQKYRRPMVSFMYRMARNAAAAEDLAQEVFLRVYRSRQSYEASAKFTTWLYRIATNLAVNHARDTRHERPEVQVSLDEPDEDSGTTLELPDRALNAEQAMVRQERMEAIRRRVEALPEQQRVAVIMHKYQQMDYKQIAEVLKKSESATKSLLFRAYETLREQLREFI